MTQVDSRNPTNIGSVDTPLEEIELQDISAGSSSPTSSATTLSTEQATNCQLASSPNSSPRPPPRHLYRGHRRQSFTALDDAELVELRARQRTFGGAYARAAIGTLGYSVFVLKIFDERFYRIGLLYCVLTAVLVISVLARRRHSRHDFSDTHSEGAGRWDGDRVQAQVQTQPSSLSSSPQFTTTRGKRIFGRPFVTAGWIVIVVSGVVMVIEIGLLVLVLRLGHRTEATSGKSGVPWALEPK